MQINYKCKKMHEFNNLCQFDIRKAFDVLSVKGINSH